VLPKWSSKRCPRARPTYSFERVLADIRDARDHGARSLFIVDDNITLNVRRFEALCRAIIDAGMTSAIANRGERLARLMREAGFRYVFLGIENILEEDLRFLRAESKNRERENGRQSGNATASPEDRLIKALTGSNFWIRTVLLAERYAARPHRAPVYMYSLDWQSPAHLGV
jgi:hypothetical protein